MHQRRVGPCRVVAEGHALPQRAHAARHRVVGAQLLGFVLHGSGELGAVPVTTSRDAALRRSDARDATQRQVCNGSRSAPYSRLSHRLVCAFCTPSMYACFFTAASCDSSSSSFRASSAATSSYAIAPHTSHSASGGTSPAALLLRLLAAL